MTPAPDSLSKNFTVCPAHPAMPGGVPAAELLRFCADGKITTSLDAAQRQWCYDELEKEHACCFSSFLTREQAGTLLDGQLARAVLTHWQERAGVPAVLAWAVYRPDGSLVRVYAGVSDANGKSETAARWREHVLAEAWAEDDTHPDRPAGLTMPHDFQVASQRGYRVSRVLVSPLANTEEPAAVSSPPMAAMPPVVGQRWKSATLAGTFHVTGEIRSVNGLAGWSGAVFTGHQANRLEGAGKTTPALVGLTDKPKDYPYDWVLL